VKAAILIGVSLYDKTLANLPACKTDVSLIQAILETTKQYDEILAIVEETNSAKVKGRISDWIEKLRSKKVEEIFFYYTGHGEFYSGEFYFPLSDYDKDKRRQTSLINSEVDTWLRSLRADMTIKVIDACHSGMIYIKDDTDRIEKYLRDTAGEFNKCYFMFSSSLEQSSYQDHLLSFFTRSFVKAIANHEAETIRYKDIVDYIADDFTMSPAQTPFFVTQSHNTEVFCVVDEYLRSVIALFGNAVVTENAIEQNVQEEAKSLSDIVADEAINYCSEEEVLTLFAELPEEIEQHKYDKEFKNLYDVEVMFEKSHTRNNNIDGRKDIANWLRENNAKFFVDILYEDEKYEAEVPNTAFFNTGRGEPTKLATKTRRVVSDFQITVELPFEGFQLIAKPKYQNLSWSNCSVLLLISKTAIRFFYSYRNYRDINWTERRLIGKPKWQTIECKMKDRKEVSATIDRICSGFSDWILTQIKERFLVEDE